MITEISRACSQLRLLVTKVRVRAPVPCAQAHAPRRALSFAPIRSNNRRVDAAGGERGHAVLLGQGLRK